MKGLWFLILGLASVLMIFSSCGSDTKVDDKTEEIKKELLNNNLQNVNKTLVNDENEQINSYIERHQFKMQETQTGLRYMIYHKTNGKTPPARGKVVIRFVVSLINGVECYNSKTDGLKQIELGIAEVESGLEEGILLMKEGEKATLIIPSHLAFGLLGDEKKIPKRATLIYDVELVQVL